MSRHASLREISTKPPTSGRSGCPVIRMFEEFLQVGTGAKKVEGTGLGLTFVSESSSSCMAGEPPPSLYPGITREVAPKQSQRAPKATT